MISKIVRVYTRKYRDNGQTTTYVEWLNARGVKGRTECDANKTVRSEHFRALLARADKEGIKHERETR
jgi:hypothetical protein